MAHLKLIKKQETKPDEEQPQDEKDQTEELTPEKKPKVFKLKQKQDHFKGWKNSLKRLKRQFKRKRIKAQQWYVRKKTNRKNKKEFRARMKNEGKRDRMLRQTTDILPFVQIYDDHILLREGVMDILQVETKNISSLNDADIEYLLMNQTQFLRSYFPSYKEVVLNFPTNVTQQRNYWIQKYNQADSDTRKGYINQKLYELDYLEKERYNREYFYFLYSMDVETLINRKEDCIQALQSSFPLKPLSKSKKEQVLFLLNNQNTKL